MNRILIFLFLSVFIISCGGDESKPEDTLIEFIKETNKGRPVNSYITGNSGKSEGGYLATREFAEKLSLKNIECETSESEAECSCETESGKIRKFTLVKVEDEWKVDLNQPEIILEIFHLMYNQGMLKEVKEFATKTELDRLNVFESMTEGMEIPEIEKRVVPFEITCKEFKKKLECICKSEEGETFYNLFKTSKGWKAELGEGNILNDSIIDYNSSEDFNLNQHDLDSLTEFSQHMLDSMLNL